jgi:glutamyl-tRNA reductase
VTANHWGRGCLVMVGVSHHATSLEVRERLTLSTAAWRELAPASAPGVLLSTCNRVEVYAWASGRGRRVAGQLRRALARAADLPPAALEPHLVTKTGADATLHLVRVAAGLDSLVVGEEQIRGQVRAAFREATASTPLPAPLVGIFQRALQAARRVRVETPLGQHPSIATAGVDVALRAPELRDRPRPALGVLVLGAGVMAKSALGHLLGAGARVTLLNRTLAHAQHLADGYGEAVTVAGLDALPEHLALADLVVCGTAARRPVLDRATVEAALAARPARPLVLLDIAVPRDVEPAVRAVPGVRLIDLDDLERLCPVDATDRAAEARRVEASAVEEARAIDTWLRVRALAPEIVRLRTRGEQIRAEELRRAAPRLRGLSPAQLSAVDELTERIVNKLLHAPTMALRERAGQRSRARRREATSC